ncbi:MAG TPA: 4-amino-4-deoxychorismate lyase [Bacillus bacterium]|uniref:aminodeoxychorismate lyase n=1 Tax=Siminovitchia fordii TaxID=254759 RepID=UPI000379C3F0|nr:aminodeoxychorismate lyase [Siminovitchia fordii]HBZ11199.1 4-amino-4-deoxychorismate lyase [Bacillus sp. (in: firmicutes)]
MYLFLNGEFIKQEEARISPFDHGYLYGMGVFETFRTYRGIPFLLDEHLERLNAGLEEMRIKRAFERAEVMPVIKKISELNRLPNSYIRMNVSSGPGQIGLQVDPYLEPTVILFQKELPPLKPLREKEAVVLTIRRNTPETKRRLKSHHFFNNIAAKRELGTDPGKEGIFLTADGYLAEGVTSSLFWVKNEKLYTPMIETGILDGITRQFILRLAGQLGIPVEEGMYREQKLAEAEEIFFTNSIQEIVPVNVFEGKSLPGKKGTVVQKLNALYQRFVSELE